MGTPALHFRPATMDDAELLLSWRNDPVTRANSHNTGAVSIEDHMKWLAAVIGDPMRRLLIAQAGDGRQVGTVRFDYNDDGSCEISWTVAPTERGNGFGKSMVAAAVADANAEVVTAEIKSENIASRRIAECAGFRLQREARGVLYFVRG